MVSPEWFIAQQIDQTGHHVPSTASNLLVAQQLGNCYFLAFLIALAVLYTTTELAVVRNYLKALWIADITHVGLTLYSLGYERSVAVHEWNAMAWGNVGVTVRLAARGRRNVLFKLTVPQVFLFLTRTAYLLGFFGPNGPPTALGKKLQ